MEDFLTFCDETPFPLTQAPQDSNTEFYPESVDEDKHMADPTLKEGQRCYIDDDEIDYASLQDTLAKYSEECWS